jgi:hypothetical protein
MLAMVGLVAARRVPHRLFLGAWTLALFAVPNVVVLSAVDFDMNKYFQITWIAVAIGAAWLIHRWPRPVIVGVLAFSAIAPTLVTAWHLVNPAVTMSTAQERAGQWIAAHTPDRAVFVTDAFINSPVDLAGRLRLATFPPYVSNLGYDPTQRVADIQAVYCDGPDVAVARMAVYDAWWVLSSGTFLDCTNDADGDGLPTDFTASDRFETVYDEGGVTIWRRVV